MRLVLRAVLPLVFLAAVLMGVMFLLRDEEPASRGVAERPESARSPDVQVPGREEPRPEGQQPAAQPQERPEAKPEEPPAPPVPEAPRSAGRIAAVLASLGPKAAAYAFVPDLGSSVAAFRQSPGFALAGMHLRVELFRDENSRSEVSRLRTVLAELERALEGSEAIALAYVSLPARLSPVFVLEGESAKRLLPILQKHVREVPWQISDLGGNLSALGDVEACGVFPGAEGLAERETPVGPVLLVRSDRQFLLYAAAALGETPGGPVQTYTSGVEEVSGKITLDGSGRAVESWEFRFKPGGVWPLTMLGGPQIDARMLGELPETSILAVAGYAEMEGILPWAEKEVSRYAPGMHLGPLFRVGLDGPGYVGLASPKGTWQAMWYGMLEPKGGGEAVRTFGEVFENFCGQAGVETASVNVEGVDVRFAKASDFRKALFASIVPAWCEKGGRLILGQGALGIKEMLGAKTLGGTEAYGEVRGEVPERASGIVFLDLPRAARLAYESQSIRVLNWLRASTGTDMDQDALPTSKDVADRLTPALFWSVSGPRLLGIEVRSPVPTALLLAFGAYILE